MTKKKRPAIKTTQRALAVLRGHGYLATVVEQWNPHVRQKKDLFGFADLLAVAPGETLAVQATTADHVASRVNKLTEPASKVAAAVFDCLRAGWRVEVWGFRREPDEYGNTLKARSLYLNPHDPEEVLVADLSLAIHGRDDVRF